MNLSRNNKGMIIVGYQGIGKTSCASKRESIIDLESSNFKVDGKKADNWHVIYCRIAVSLARQGYTVLVSSHPIVVEELYQHDSNGDYDIFIVCPHFRLKDLWIEKLHKRYLLSKDEKDYIAWRDAESHFDEEILWLSKFSLVSHIFIETMDYSITGIVYGLRSMMRSGSIPISHERAEGC